MKMSNRSIYFLIMISLMPMTFVSSQVTGLWSVVDEKDGVEKSIIEIYEVDNQYYGRIHQLLPTSKRTHCEKCNGDLKDQPLTGMTILYNLKKTTNGGSAGKVLNPDNGNFYSCNIELASQDTLKLRGYLGTPTVGKTQYWYRYKRL